MSLRKIAENVNNWLHGAVIAPPASESRILKAMSQEEEQRAEAEKRRSEAESRMREPLAPINQARRESITTEERKIAESLRKTGSTNFKPLPESDN